LVTTQRLLRRRPAVLVSNHTRMIDVAAELGDSPVGDGRYSKLTRLPGNQIFQVEFSERTLTLPRLPEALDGLTILHLSDLHMCGTPDRVFFQYVIDRCNEWNPELVAVTGDITDGKWHHRWIGPTLGRLRWQVGAFAILGNHDFWHVPDMIRQQLEHLDMH